MIEIEEEILRTVRYLNAFQQYQREAAENMIRLAESSAEQLRALNLCLDLIYRARSELSRSEGIRELVDAVEETVILNREIIERVSEARNNMLRLKERLVDMEN